MDQFDARFPVMGTRAHVAVLGGGADLVDRARHRLEDLEQRWSRFLVDSEISRLNRSTGTPVVVSPVTFQVVAAAVDAWHWSGGHFDPTLARTMDLAGYDRWRRPDGPGGVGEAQTMTPGDEPVRHEPSPGAAGIVLDPYPGSVTVPEGVSIDLGGIGKGAAADLVATELLAAGADGCCVNLGGDLRLAGHPPRPEGWRIAVDLGEGIEPVMVGLTDGAVCTSASTRRRWDGDLGPEHHLREPATGRPLSTGVSAVTVIAARAAQAEVLTTAAFAAGPDEAPKIIASVGATGLLATEDRVVTAMDGLDPFLAAAGACASGIVDVEAGSKAGAAS